MTPPLGTREDWTHPGARALVLLQEQELRRFLEVWTRAKQAGLSLPAADGPHMSSLDAILFHVLRAAGGYLVGVCGMLELPDPGVPEPPPLERVADEGADYLELLLTAWYEPLRGVSEHAADHTTGETPWGVTYCVDALLEHAVVHPMRHALQLEEWLASA